MPKFIVAGGIPLKGQVQVSGAKNAAVKMIVASILTSEPVILENVPRIGDVEVDLSIVKGLGVKARWLGRNKLWLRADKLSASVVPSALSRMSRVSALVLGPLLGRLGEARVFQPGGCRIGLRPIDRHLKALEALGAEVKEEEGAIWVGARKLRGGGIVFAKNTVMGTESAILTAVLAEGETEILNAAREPEVDDLILLLTKMGAKIKRNEKRRRRIVVEGRRSLGGARHEVIPDRNEAATFALAAAVTGGDITVDKLRPKDLFAFLEKLDEVGANYQAGRSTLRVRRRKGEVLRPAKVETAPHPGFMTDWQQPFSVLLTQAEGESSVHETIYEDRFGYVKELTEMGAKVKVITPSEAGLPFDPGRYNFDWNKAGEPRVVARIEGSAPLRGARLAISDLRAGATLVLAALAAEGVSEVSGVEHIDRGYEKFDEKLRGLGAKIKRVEW